jgi:hypothetical protein
VQRRAAVVELGLLARPLVGLDHPQPLDPGRRVRSAAGQRAQRRVHAAVELDGRPARVVALGLGAAQHDDLRLVAERAAEPQPEVHRHADDERDVGALQRLASRAREEELVVGGHAAARQPVEEDRDPAALGELQQGALALAPVQVGAGHDHRASRVVEQRQRALDALGHRLVERVG